MYKYPRDWVFGLFFTYLFLLVPGCQLATAVSDNGLKYTEPSLGSTARPTPCELFLPTSCTGSSSVGPACRTLVATANIRSVAIGWK